MAIASVVPSLVSHLKFCVAPASLAVLVYFNSLSGDLVHDDVFAIKENADVRPSSPLSNLLTNDFWGEPMASPTSHKSYRPLTVLTFRLNYLWHGLEPFGYHVVNVTLHILTTVLLGLFCRREVFGGRRKAGREGAGGWSLVVMLVFAAHPVHTEAVGWPVCVCSGVRVFRCVCVFRCGGVFRCACVQVWVWYNSMFLLGLPDVHRSCGLTTLSCKSSPCCNWLWELGDLKDQSYFSGLLPNRCKNNSLHLYWRNRARPGRTSSHDWWESHQTLTATCFVLFYLLSNISLPSLPSFLPPSLPPSLPSRAQVSGVVGRADVLASLLFLVALLCYCSCARSSSWATMLGQVSEPMGLGG